MNKKRKLIIQVFLNGWNNQGNLKGKKARIRKIIKRKRILLLSKRKERMIMKRSYLKSRLIKQRNIILNIIIN